MSVGVDASKLIVFSDLDGTLLDHHSYEYAPALPTIRRLHALNVPLILASSKTAAEMVQLRADLELTEWPMICENGSGLVPAGDTTSSDATDYYRLRAALNSVPSHLRAHFTGFGDMGPATIADVTGLTEASAQLAADREFSEPGIWNGSDTELDDFLATLDLHGISARRGGRFLTLSFGANKADQIESISEALGRKTIVALGDAPNDAEMLAAADYAIVLPNAQGHPVPVPRDGTKPVVIDAVSPGPSGWHDTLSGLLNRLGLDE